MLNHRNVEISLIVVSPWITEIYVLFLAADVDISQLMKNVMCEESSKRAVFFSHLLLKSLAKKRKSLFFPLAINAVSKDYTGAKY